MYLFFKIQKNYLKEIKIHHYALFIAILSITNAVKPNFILAFAPTLAIFLAIDFFKNIKDKKSIIHIFVLGFAILFSLTILLYQANVLYGHKAPDKSGIEFSFMTVISYFSEHPILSLIQSTAFPAYILITNFKTIIKNKQYLFCTIMYMVSLFIYLCINETGPRKYHGNFTWTIDFALMVLFTSFLAILDKSRFETRKFKKIYLVGGYSIFIAHLLFGIMYFIRLSKGITFFKFY